MKKVDDMNPSPRPSSPPDKPADSTIRRRTANRALTGVAAAAGALIAVAGLAACGAAAPPHAGGAAPSRTPASATAQNTYYPSMMRGDFGGMMGGGNRWMMGAAGYRWMTGVNGVPRWMRSRSLPAFMMGTGTDPRTLMGRLWADAPGPRVSPAQAARLSSQIPARAEVNRAARVITSATASVRLVVVASPRGGPDEACPVPGHARQGMSGLFNIAA